MFAVCSTLINPLYGVGSTHPISEMYADFDGALRWMEDEILPTIDATISDIEWRPGSALVVRILEGVEKNYGMVYTIEPS